MTDAIIVLCTCANEGQALNIAEMLVEERLAACVNLTAGIRSVYRWEGKLETADEALLIIKTTRERWDALRDRIIELHSYDTPEILALPVMSGSDKYLAWIAANVG